MEIPENENSIEQTITSAALDSKAGYRYVFKATSVFGGVQLFNILISLVRGKLVAVLIGSAGMGLNGLLLSSLSLVNKISGLGLSESAVRDISAASASNDTMRIRCVYTVFKRWIWLSAIIGFILTITLSPILSKIAFGDRSHYVSFLLLSVTFIFGALTGGIYTLLRGMRRIKDLARANITGSVSGLLVAIPIFYFYGIGGVVPAIIATSAVTYVVSLYFKRKVGIKSTELTLGDTYRGGKQMINLGMILSISALMGSGMSFILNAYISRTGSLGDLGIFNAGDTIMAGYVGMVFTAMGTDYYPRLSGVIQNPHEWKKVVNQQSETVLLILGAILPLILLTAPLLIKVLLSKEFLLSIDYIIWASLAVVLKGIVWVSGFILIAKGDNKVFLFTEFAAQIWFLLFNLIFYNLMGIQGLGISMTLSYLLSAIMMFLVLKKRYSFALSRDTYWHAFAFLTLLAISVVSVKVFAYPRAYFIAGVTSLISLIISFKGLNDRMNLKNAIKVFIHQESGKNR